MKLDRLLGITVELFRKKRVTAAELAARYEVSVRTIYRDVELINQAGIPIASFTGADGGFELMSGFHLSRQHFSFEDFAIIYNLLKGMEGAMGGKAANLSQKLSSLQPALRDGGCHTVILNASASEQEKQLVQVLLQAIQRKQLIAFAYRSATGSYSERTAEPYSLLWEKGAWYLEAYCLLRRAKRYFRVSRISQPALLESNFAPRDETEMQENQDEANAGIQAVLHFGLAMQTRVMEQFPGECERKENIIEVRTTFYQQTYAISVILSYGDQVKVLEPKSLIEPLLEQLVRIQRKYLKESGG